MHVALVYHGHSVRPVDRSVAMLVRGHGRPSIVHQDLHQTVVVKDSYKVDCYLYLREDEEAA